LDIVREAHKCGELSVTIPRESLREKGWREALEQANFLTSPTTKPHILSLTYKYGWVQHLILIPLTTSPLFPRELGFGFKSNTHSLLMLIWVWGMSLIFSLSFSLPHFPCSFARMISLNSGSQSVGLVTNSQLFPFHKDSAKK
jgi:hypothetical protein